MVTCFILYRFSLNLVCYPKQVETIRASGLDVTLVLASAVAEASVPPSSVSQVRF